MCGLLWPIPRLTIHAIAFWFVLVCVTKAALEPPVASNPTGFLRYVMRIVDNIQVEVKNIHVRYEDDVSGISRDDSVPSRVFALGVTLGSVTINTVNEQGEPAYMMEFAPVNKRVRLERGPFRSFLFGACVGGVIMR
jgi:hypothetical protein